MATAGTFSYIYDGGLNITNALTSVTATYSAGAGDDVIYTNFVGNGSSASVTLPYAAQAGVGKKITIYTAGITSSIKVQTTDTINGTATPPAIGQTSAKTYYSDGISKWFNV